MNTNFRGPLRSLWSACLLGAAWGGSGFLATAQTGPVLHLTNSPPYVVLVLTGAVAGVHSIQGITDLSQAGTPGGWQYLGFLRTTNGGGIWTDRTTRATNNRIYRTVESPESTNRVFVLPGTFTMGSPASEPDRFDREGPQMRVTITRGFWMSTHEVTQAEYAAVMGRNPSQFTGNTRRPVEEVSWRDATNYCARLTQQERAAGRIATNSVYRLPTEAEWEYACRGGTTTRFGFGNDSTYVLLPNYAWCSDNAEASTHPVEQKIPNAYGLHDMHGNVWEWCLDFYGEYPGGTLVDPLGPDVGTTRVIRGGGWGSAGQFCRSAHRTGRSPEFGLSDVGFRVVLSTEAP